jgi:hypothetical protein
MITHQHIGMHHPACLGRRFAEAFEERLLGAVFGEDVIAIVAAIDDVITSAEEFDPEFSGHMPLRTEED